MQTNAFRDWDPRQLHYYDQTYAGQTGEVVGYWKAILSTLVQRGMLQVRRRQGAPVIPEADALLFADRCLFVLDMHRLGGIPKEQWRDRAWWDQCCDAMQGRRVFVSDGGGLAITVARQPGQPKRKRLPAQIPLDLSHLPTEPYRVRMGETTRGPVHLDIADDHRAILVGATSGGGKTMLMKSVLLQLAARHTPEELALAIIDPKRVDFGPMTPFARLPHLFAPVAYMDGAAELIGHVFREFVRRQAIMAAAGVADWRQLDDERPPLLLLVADEVAQLKSLPAMDTLILLAREARAMGISLLVGTQHPTAKVIDSQMKANLPTRIAFQTATRVESQTILDNAGAERLKRPGLALSYLAGGWQTVQTYWVDQEAAQIFVKEVSAPKPPALTQVEADLVRYAVDRLGGAFTINKIAPVFRGSISKQKLADLAQRWEACGWLTRPAHAAASRFVTDDLLALLPPTQDGEGGDTGTGGTGGTGSGQPGKRAGTGPGTGVDTPGDTQDTPREAGTGPEPGGEETAQGLARRPSVLATLQGEELPLVG